MKARLIALIALVALPFSPLLIGTAEAHRTSPAMYAVDSGRANVRVEIMIQGSPAVVYRDGSHRWIEGRRGERFAFRITNNNGFPVGVIPSADGHSLTADGRAAASHPAYVLGPYQSETISVWRENLNGGRELVFTDVERSLAAKKGDARNVGVLGVLVWRLEDRQQPYPVPMDRREGAAGRDGSYGGQGSRKDSARAPSAAGADEARSRPKAGEIERPDPQGIGVGAGNSVDDRAYMTDRYRRVSVLDMVSVYYDDRAGLSRAGVNLNQYQNVQYYPPREPDRRQSDPFPNYQGVRIP